MKISCCLALVLALFVGNIAPANAGESFMTPTGVLQWDEKKAYNGYTIVSPSTAKNTYLIDMKGKVVHKWETNYLPGLYAELLPNGNLLRGFRMKGTVAFAGASGGVQELDWDGNVVWEHKIYDKDHSAHHCFNRMENGNTLVLAWERKTYDEAIKKGRKAGTIPKGDTATTTTGKKYGDLWPDYLVEIDAKGNEVWSWHVWDHVGKGKDQFDLNFILPMAGYYGSSDWTHFNSVQYNQDTNQILLCSRNFGEIYIIDKATGKMVYRWGNPSTHGQGKGPSFLDDGDQQLFGPHSATWLDNDKVLIFDNGWQKPEVNRSRVLILNTKTNKIVWEFIPQNSNSFYSAFQGAAQMLPNGNVLVTSTNTGHIFEITQDKKPEIVWEFISPWAKKKALGMITEADAMPWKLGAINLMFNYVHRAYRYSPDYAGLKGKKLSKGKYPVPGAPDWLKLYKKASKLEVTIK